MLLYVLIPTICAIITLFLKPSSVTFKILSAIVVIGTIPLLMDDIANGRTLQTILDVIIMLVWTCDIFIKSDTPAVIASISIKKEERQ